MSDPVHKFNLRLPYPLYARLTWEAAESGMSLNAYILAHLNITGPLEQACDHEPYRELGLSHCFRCGSPL